MSAHFLRVILLAGLTCRALAAGAADAPAAPGHGAPGQDLPGLDPPGHLRLESDRGPLLLGEVDAVTILAEFPDWPEDLDDWQPDATAVAALRSVTSSTDILCVLGTWCGDSQREVPRFWRLLEATANPHLRLTMVAVGRAGSAPANQALADLGLGGDYRTAQGIEKVPTFIFSHDGQEIGRIVEIPVQSLAADTAAILAGAGLLPAAAGAPDQGAGWR